MTHKSRDRNDLIIVQEKIDGSNCSVAKIKGEILALTRAGYIADTSPYKQHHYFQKWVENQNHRFDILLNEGERIVGEWIMEACGTKYNLIHEPFVVFDLLTEHTRITYHEFLIRVLPYGFTVPRLLNIGQPFKIEKAKKMIKTSGHGAIDEVEGFVYRCEREGKVDFLCKWVRPDKIDGKYMHMDETVWNIEPNKLKYFQNWTT